MGLIKAVAGSLGGVFADQWKEYFYCDALGVDTICVKGLKRVSNRSSNYHGSSNVISTGSIIAVADGQCMLVVEQGKVVEVCAEPGEYVFDSTKEPSIFAGKLDKASISAVFRNVGKRIGFGGEAPVDQRVYYFNTKEFTGNPYGTPAPVPFRVVDRNVGLDVDITIRCFGEYSYCPLLLRQSTRTFANAKQKALLQRRREEKNSVVHPSCHRTILRNSMRVIVCMSSPGRNF